MWDYRADSISRVQRKGLLYPVRGLVVSRFFQCYSFHDIKEDPHKGAGLIRVLSDCRISSIWNVNSIFPSSCLFDSRIARSIHWLSRNRF